MVHPRSIFLVLGLFAAFAAAAQVQGQSIRRSGAPGLQPAGAGFRIACGTVAFPCDDAPGMRLSAAVRDRPVLLDLQAGNERQPWQGLRLGLAGKPLKDSEFGLYGRWSGAQSRPASNLQGGAVESAGSYGLGVSWDFTPNTSATLGWDSYDLRQGGAERELRATSLGLQWRY